jgi:hypothetical protein
MDENKEILWRQYQQHIDTYKFYLDIVVKLMGFYFAISGAIISFYASNSGAENIKLALFLPLIMGAGLLIFFSIGAVLSLVTRSDVFEIRDSLGLQVAPETGVLTLLLAIFSVVLFVCVGGLGYVLWCSNAL